MTLPCNDGRAKFCRACDFLFATYHSKRVFDAHQHYADLKQHQLQMSYDLYDQRNKIQTKIEQMGKTLDPGHTAQTFIMLLL